MSLVDATTSQNMATKHIQSVKAVQWGLQEVNALLAKMLKNGKVKYDGYGTNAVWYVRKLAETASWVSGQLGTRSFEEKDPMAEATLPFCFTEQTYGVSEKSIKTNRAAGSEKIFDIQKENALVAQSALYRAIVDALYSNVNTTTSLTPVGLMGICGDPYSNSNVSTVSAGKSYAGISLSADGATILGATTNKWDTTYWHPTVIDALEVDGTSTWSDDCIKILSWMCDRMARTADVSGTGKILQPDMALMGKNAWSKMKSKLIDSQTGVNGVAVGTTDPALAKFTTIRVGTLDCVCDENVPNDGNTTGLERVLVLDSNAFYIHTLNKKSEGLVEGEWDASDPKTVGGVGLYKANMTLICETPLAVGCVVGCDQ